MTLSSYIKDLFQDGIAYEDAVQLCLALHVRFNLAPSEKFGSAGDRGELSDTFAELALEGVIRDGGFNASRKSHWLSVLESIYTGQANMDFTWADKFPNLFPIKPPQS